MMPKESGWGVGPVCPQQRGAGSEAVKDRWEASVFDWPCAKLVRFWSEFHHYLLLYIKKGIYSWISVKCLVIYLTFNMFSLKSVRNSACLLCMRTLVLYLATQSPSFQCPLKLSWVNPTWWNLLKRNLRGAVSPDSLAPNHSAPWTAPSLWRLVIPSQILMAMMLAYFHNLVNC